LIVFIFALDITIKMTITQLNMFLVAEHKISLAAEKCFVTQPTLSMQIQKIEEELSIQIDRTKKTN
jgi:LysR family hydrogen peroxide-inducible transcriptional activator